MLQPQFIQEATSSFCLWLDNKLCSKGGYTNYSGSFYRVPSPFSNYYSYGAVAAQMIADTSISGANIMTGIFINNTPIITGQSGFIDIDYKHGLAYFNNNINYNISGYYSIKDFNIILTDKQDDILLFKTQYNIQQKITQNPTGINYNNITYPVIFVKLDGNTKKPYAFGGTEWETIHLRCLILSDSLWKLHAVQGILSDTIRTPIALFSSNDMPFNSNGGLKSGVFNYTGMAYPKIRDQNFIFIENVTIPKFAQQSLQNDNFNYDVFFNLVDFELSKIRDVR